MKRAQTAYSLDLKYIKVEEDEIQRVFPPLLKQTRPGKHLKLSTLNYYKTNLKYAQWMNYNHISINPKIFDEIKQD